MALGADQVNKLRELPRHGRDVFAYHLDEMTPHLPSTISYLRCINLVMQIRCFFVFASSQLLTEQQKGQRLLQSLFDLT